MHWARQSLFAIANPGHKRRFLLHERCSGSSHRFYESLSIATRSPLIARSIRSSTIFAARLLHGRVAISRMRP